MSPALQYDILRRLDFSRPALAAVARALEGGDAPAAAMQLLAYYRIRPMRFHFDPDEPLRDLDRIADHPLDQTALEPLMSHLFFLAGCPPVNAGPVIDWRQETGYLQWHCQLCRHPFWLTLTEAWRRTGDARYIAELAAQLKSWDAQVPPHFPAEGLVRAIDPGIRLAHWMRLFPVAVMAAPFDEETLLRFLTHVHGACEYLNAHGAGGYCPGNHGVFEAMGVLQAGVYLPEFKQAVVWRRDASACIGGRILADIRPDGGQMEQSTSYHADMLDTFLTYLKLQALSGDPPLPEVRDRLDRMWAFLAALRMPGGMWAALGDSKPADWSRLIERGGAILHRPDMSPLDAEGGAGSVLSFPQSGLTVLRGAHQGSRERWLLFDTGAHGGWHGHYDLLQVVAGGCGRAFLVDPGCGRYDHQWRPLMRSTLMHNTVSVDFHDYLDEGALDTGAPSRAVLVRSDPAGPVKVLCGWHEAYSTPRERVVVERLVAMVREDYWIVVDRVRAERLHEFASAWHFAPGVLRPLSGLPGVATSFPDSNMAIIPLFGNARFSTLPRWHAPDDAGAEPSPVWVAEGVGREWLFAVALIPYPGEQVPLKAFSVASAPGGFSVRLAWAVQPDELVVRFGPEPGEGTVRFTV